MQALKEKRHEALARLSKTQWELLLKIFDVQGCSLGPQQDLREIITGYLLDGVSGQSSPSISFRGARYLNHRPELNGSITNPFLHFLFSEIGEAALMTTFATLSISETALLRGAFDESWYIYQNDDVERSGVDGFIHYMVDGWRQGCDPSPGFSTTGYLRRYADIAASGINPFQHWVLYGREEGRIALEQLDSLEFLETETQAIVEKLFDAKFYREETSNSETDPAALLADYLLSGWKRGLNPTRSFNGYLYSKLYRSKKNPFVHYLVEMCGLRLLRDVFDPLPASVITAIRDAFDEDWYCCYHPDISARGEDPFIHYMSKGWIERRDPSPEFSTNAYLCRYPDIKSCLMNPFHHWVLHGRGEGRVGSSAVQNIRNRPYRPNVCAVLVNTADAIIDLPMLSTILGQSYAHLEFVAVGLPLAADVRKLLDNEESRQITFFDLTSRDSPNNLTDVWQIGANATGAELLWFVGGNILYAPNFVEKAISSFADHSVEIVFGSLSPSNGLDRAASISVGDDYEKAAKWNRHVVKLAADWFASPAWYGQEVECHRTFVWRRSSLPIECWQAAATMGSYGPLLLYIHMLAGGQVAWVRDAIAVTHNGGMATDRRIQTSGAMQTLVAELRRVWGIPRSAVEFYLRAAASQEPSGFFLHPVEERECKEIDHAMLLERSKMHVLLLSHGIFAGGGENFPIQLANSLREMGIIVSILIFNTSKINEEMRRTIDPRVAIYEAEFVAEYGSEKFVKDAGFSIIHSHGVVGEKHFFDAWDAKLRIPYLVTLHGSYENSSEVDLPETFMAKIERRVDHFCYTAEKNLMRLAPYAVEQVRLTKIINAMPIDPVAFPLTRAEMGIGEDAVVFTFVARGVREKGWEIAINAFKATQNVNPHRLMHLCLVGEGEETDRLREMHSFDPTISFLGYQLRIHGLYRISDVAIVPTRFSGESFPLCIIQAMQVALPVIACNIGDIAGMLSDDDKEGGILIPFSSIDSHFTFLFATAMGKMLDCNARKALAEGASLISRRYDMQKLTTKYIELYRSLILQGKIRPDDSKTSSRYSSKLLKNALGTEFES